MKRSAQGTVALTTFLWGLSGLGCDAFAPKSYRYGSGGTGGVVVAGTGGFFSPPSSGGGLVSGGGISLGSGGWQDSSDPDMDWLPNSAEYPVGLNPKKRDTDDDGCPDYFDSAFSACDALSLTSGPGECQVGNAATIPVLSATHRGRPIRVEYAWYSSEQLGLGGAPFGGAWTKTLIDQEESILGDERPHAVIIHDANYAPDEDQGKNAAGNHVARVRVRALDVETDIEIANWVAYVAFKICLVP